MAWCGRSCTGRSRGGGTGTDAHFLSYNPKLTPLFMDGGLSLSVGFSRMLRTHTLVPPLRVRIPWDVFKKRNAPIAGGIVIFWRRAGDSPRCLRQRSTAPRLRRSARHKPEGLCRPCGFESPRCPRTKKRPIAGAPYHSGGELGIRTPDRIESYTRLAGEHLRPLGQLSVGD